MSVDAPKTLTNLDRSYNFHGMKTRIAILFCVLIPLISCENPVKKAARHATYSAYEMVGVEKRDLLKRRVDDARDEQGEAGKEFQNALKRLKAIYGFDGGNLEKEYDKLNSAYEQSVEQAQSVTAAVDKVESVATDLFKEWESEIDQIETASLKTSSRDQLRKTRARYNEMHKALSDSEARMEPVLKKLRDHVLYLKHNLNANAIGSLKTESLRIQGDIEKLIDEMNKSIASADKFIKEM